MPDLFETVRRASFGGIEFPFTDYTIRGSLRHHVHEYIKRPGAEVEELARRAYEFTFKCRFVDVMEGYVDLYPSKLSALISLCEIGKSNDLWVPTMGRSFKCKATTWVRSISAMMRSGEDVEFSFLEDSTEQFTTLNLIGVRSAAITPKVVLLTEQITALRNRTASSFFDDLLKAIDALLGIIDTIMDIVDLAKSYVSLYTALIDGVLLRCNALANVPVMQSPLAAAALRALIEVWAVVAHMKAQALAAQQSIVSFIVDRPTMSVIDVSMEVYNTPNRSGQILRLNDFDNPLAIPRGTLVRYFAV